MSHAKFASMMEGIAEYYDKNITGEVIALYWNALNSYSYDEIQTAVQKHMNDPDEGQFMPKIAHINKYLVGSKDTRAMLAWSKVEKAVREVGPYASVCFDEAIIHKTLQDMGGWINLCNMTDRDLPFKANEFRTRYQGYAKDGGVKDYPKLLTGISDAHNAKEGFDRREVRAIGDQSKARLVYKGGCDTPTLTGLLEQCVD